MEMEYEQIDCVTEKKRETNEINGQSDNLSVEDSAKISIAPDDRIGGSTPSPDISPNYHTTKVALEEPSSYLLAVEKNDKNDTIADATAHFSVEAVDPTVPELSAAPHPQLSTNPSLSESTVRTAMTVAAALLAVAAVLSVFAVTSYHLFLACVWIILLTLFVGFCFFIQETILSDAQRQQRRRVFHPVVHAVADWISYHVTAFVEDCRDEYQWQMLTNGSADSSSNEYNTNVNKNGDPRQHQQERRQPRSPVFRVLVQPFSQWNQRRRTKRRERQARKNNGPENVESTSYVPPQPTEAEVM